jgi:hypothetical protein
MIDSLLDRKTVVSGGSMPICGDNAPDNAIGSRQERREADFEEFRVGVVNTGISLIHFLTRHILNGNGAERRIQSDYSACSVG